MIDKGFIVTLTSQFYRWGVGNLWNNLHVTKGWEVVFISKGIEKTRELRIDQLRRDPKPISGFETYPRNFVYKYIVSY